MGHLRGNCAAVSDLETSYRDDRSQISINRPPQFRDGLLLAIIPYAAWIWEGAGGGECAATDVSGVARGWPFHSAFALSQPLSSPVIFVRHIHRTVHRRGNGPQAFHQAMKVVEGQALLAV